MSKKYQEIYRKMVDEVRSVPGDSRQYPSSISLIILPSFNDHIHFRLEWNEETFAFTRKVWIWEPHANKSKWKGDRYVLNVHESDFEISTDIEMKHLSAEVSQIEDLLEILSQTTFLMTPKLPNGICLDGTGYELSLTSWMTDCTWRWHDDLPKAWKGLEEIIHYLRNFSFKGQDVKTTRIQI